MKPGHPLGPPARPLETTVALRYRFSAAEVARRDDELNKNLALNSFSLGLQGVWGKERL